MEIKVEKDMEFEQALEPTLAFYGTQLQSHAATMVAFSIGFFALLQTWASFRPGGVLASIVFSILGTSLISIGTYAFLRLLAYGQLSKSILVGSREDFTEFLKKYRSQNKNWDVILPYTKVSYYASCHFEKYWLRKRHLLGLIPGKTVFTERAQPKRSLLLITAAMFFLVLVFFVFE